MATTSDLYLSGSGALTTSGTTTTLSNLFVLPTGAGVIDDAASCTLIISNPSASGQTITSGSLQFSDTVGGVVSTLTYSLPGTVSIAAGANQTFQIALTNGLLKNVTVSVTFGSNPSAGTLSVLLIPHAAGGSTTVTSNQGTAGTSAWPVQPEAGTSGGASVTRISSAASNNATNVKATAGQVYGARVTNRQTAYPVYVKLYNKATAPAPATDNALIVDVIEVPAATSSILPSVVTYNLPVGCAGFSSGIGFAIVQGVSDTDNTSVAANDALLSLYWN